MGSLMDRQMGEWLGRWVDGDWMDGLWMDE